MPLIHSGSDAAFKTNLHTLFHEVGKSPHVQSRDQALAIAYALKRRGRAEGGATPTGFGFPNEPPSPAPAPPSMNPGWLPAPPAAAPSAPSPGVLPAWQGAPAGMNPPGSWIPPSFPGGIPRMGAGPMPMPASWAMPGGMTTGTVTPGPMPASPAMPGGMVSGTAPTMTFTNPALGAAYRARGYAFGGGPAPWQLRSEARSMMHSGPIMSAVPGRTDRHNMSLAAGSYVIPSQAVSHLGQNNTMAGMKVLNGMFGAGGPYGSSAMKIGHGAGAPKPPPVGRFAHGGGYDAGGARGDSTGAPVEVVTAGGEYVLTPEQVAAVGGGDVSHGHNVLDAWVNKIKQDHVRTLQKLPGPAKS